MVMIIIMSMMSMMPSMMPMAMVMPNFCQCVFDFRTEENDWNHEEGQQGANAARYGGGVCRCTRLAILGTLCCRLAEVQGGCSDPENGCTWSNEEAAADA